MLYPAQYSHRTIIAICPYNCYVRRTMFLSEPKKNSRRINRIAIVVTVRLPCIHLADAILLSQNGLCKSIADYPILHVFLTMLAQLPCGCLVAIYITVKILGIPFMH